MHRVFSAGSWMACGNCDYSLSADQPWCKMGNFS